MELRQAGKDEVQEDVQSAENANRGATFSKLNKKFNIKSDRILGQIVRKLLNLKHHPFANNKATKSKCCFCGIDEKNAGVGLPTCSIPTEGKIPSRRFRSTPRKQVER